MTRRTMAVLLVLAASAGAQTRKSIFMITDAEGVAGVCRQDQTDPKDSEMRQLLTGEINAAVDGLLAGAPTRWWSGTVMTAVKPCPP